MKLADVKKEMKVADSGWPWRVGIVLWVKKTRCRVRWMTGDLFEWDREWTYDRAHCQFLQEQT